MIIAVMPCGVGQFLVPVIAQEHADRLIVPVGAYDYLAYVSVGHQLAVFVQEGYFVARSGPSHGAGAYLHARIGSQGKGGFGLAEALHQVDAGVLEKPAVHLIVEGLPRVGGVFQAGQVVPVHPLLDEEAVDVCRKFTKLKLRLLPYLYSMAVKSHRTGIPSMRAMIMEFNDDPATKYLDMQYMLGDSILVAPIFNKEGHAEYYLPAGKWTHLLSGEVKEGGRWYEEDYDFSSLPVFVRENTLLPIGAVDTTVDYEPEKDVQIQVYEVNETASCEVVTRKGETAFTVKAVRQGNKLTLEASAENGGMTYLLRNIHEIADVTGGSIVKDTENGIIIVPEGCRQEIEL